MAKRKGKSKGAPKAAMGDHVEKDSDLHPKSGKPPLEPDELVKRRAVREATRNKTDQYLVESDLDDAEQRFPLPNMKEQE
jgi:hypothetical protein